MAEPNIIVIEDDRNLNALLSGQLAEEGFRVTSAHSCREGRALLEGSEPNLMIIDIRLPDGDGFEFIRQYGEIFPIIVLTAYGTVDQAVEAVQAGASDYLLKPISFDALKVAIGRALATVELKRDVQYWQKRAQKDLNVTIVGNSPKVAHMRHLIELYAVTDSSLLIVGESGVGKELVAHAIHEKSDRNNGLFVAVDCDPAQESNVAQEFLGEEQTMRGGTRREGMLAIAQNGTIYVNNVAEMSLALQSKLLRVMETGTFRRVGGTQDLVTNVRILAATSSNLQARIADDRFRSELFYRLNAFCIEVPPLRDRLTDVPLLAEHFLKYRNFQRGIDKRLAADTIAALTDYAWPGNVRELRNAIERGVIMSGQEEEITAAHVGISATRSAAGDHGGVVLGFDYEPTMEEVRDHYIRMLLRRYDGNRRKVAGILGISERNTYRLVGKLEADGETGGLGGAAE